MIKQTHSLVLAVFLCVAVIFLSTSVAQEADTVTVHKDGSATYQWAPDTVFSAELHLNTSNPGIFTGVAVEPIIGADRFHTAGWTGQSTIAANIEAGHIWSGHESLNHVTSFTNHATAPGAPFVTPAYDRHATAVGMMIGGRQTATANGNFQQGVAYNTDLRSGAIATSWTSPAYATGFGLTAASVDAPYSSGASSFGTADVINSSWGSGWANSGGFDFQSLQSDSLGFANPNTVFVTSAGNSGTPGGSDTTVGAPGLAYNNITVGALQNDGSNNYTTMASFSSRGAASYFDTTNGLILAATAQRAVVDIVAPGTDLTSAYYGGQTGGNDPSLAGSAASGGPNFYAGGQAGTSFSAPIVAGGVSLMQSAAKGSSVPATSLDARVIKANLLNGAAKIPGWNNGQIAHSNGNGGVITGQALDFTSGAGSMDLDQTFDQYLSGQTDIAGTNGGTTSNEIGWDFATVSNGSNVDVVISPSAALLGGSDFTATLSWFRDRTYNGVGNFTDNAMANLDLEVWDSTFTTLFSESNSLYNTVEHLHFSLPITGSYGLRVVHSGNWFGSVADVDFGLAWSGVLSPIPEPGAFSLFAIGLICLSGRRRK